MEDRRKHSRTPLNATVKVWHQGGETLVKTADVSHGGAFLVYDRQGMPPIGSIVEVQIQGLAEAAPIQRMRVVRAHGRGIGLEFADPEDEAPARTAP